MKKTVSLLLSFILVFSLCVQSAAAFAGELVPVTSVEENIESEKVICKTSYRNVKSLADSDDLEDYRYVSNFDELSLYLRDRMVLKNENINVYIPYSDETITLESIKAATQKARSESISCGAEDGDYFVLNSVDKYVWDGYGKTVNNKVYYVIEYTVNYRSTAEMEQEVSSTVDGLVQSLSGACDYDTVKNIHDFICDNTDYDYAGSYIEGYTDHQRAYNALILKKAVCGGYASLFYRIAKACGFKVRIVRCEKLNHAWNAIELDGKWYYIDCTWDDVDDVDGGAGMGGYTAYTHFLKGSTDFTDHDTAENYELGRGDGKVSDLNFAETGYTYTSGCETHNYVEETAVYPACSDNYFALSRCSVCGELKREPAEKAEHTVAEFPEVASTCTVAGLTACEYCSECNKLLSEREKTRLAEHTNVVDEGVEPTCTESGLTEGTHCSVCNTVTKEREYVEPKGHDFALDKVIEPTCTEGGYSIYKCSRCEETETKDETEAKGHDMVLSEVIKPTCTKGGYSVYKCSRCEETEIRDEVAAKGHSFVSYEKYCSVCGEVNPNYAVPVPKIRKLKSGKRRFTLYRKDAVGITAYEIQYSTKKNFKKAKTKRIKYSAKKKTIKKLKKNKKYYVRIRGVNGDDYSKWSPVMTVKTK